MLKKYLPHTSLIGMLIIAFLIRIYLFSRRKTDPTALDAYNITQIAITIFLGFVIVIRRDFIPIIKILMRSPLVWLLALYCFGVLSGLWSAIPLFSTYFAIEGLLYIIAFSIILVHQQDDKSMERVAIYFSYAFIFIIIGAYIKASGISLNLANWHSNNYSTIAAMLFGYCFGEQRNNYRDKTDEERKLLRRGLWVSLFFVVLGTSSASNIALVTTVLVVALISGRKSFKIFSIILFVLVLLINHLYGDMVFKILFPGKTIESVEMLTGRTRLWENYFDLIRQKPLIGWGFSVISRTSGTYATHTHNSLIEITSGVGFVGLIFYLIYFVSMSVKLIRNIHSPYTVGVVGALAAGFVNSLTISFVGAAAGAIFFAFIIWNVFGLFTLLSLNNYYDNGNEDNLGNA